ncbi:artemin [Rhineura floridana]|uniref:artemin n=1 Tax=Rhineura floridana TaxID=261503 RepID=UPI002AC8928A|nr:artemin [Rhineura floridana]
MEPVLFSFPEDACPGVLPASGSRPKGRAPRRLLALPCAVSPAQRGWGSWDRGCPPDPGQDASRSNPIFPRRGAMSPPGTCRPCRRRERRASKGAIPAGPGYGPRGRLNAGAAEEPLPPSPPGGSGFDALEGPVPVGRGRRFPARSLGGWSPQSRAQREVLDLPRRSARMEWRVEGPRHRSDRSPSTYRSLPVRQVRYREWGLWGTITLLSLFAGAVMATSQTWHHNQTLGADSDGSMGTASPPHEEENSREAPSLAAWSHWHGENMTIEGLSSSELLRAERSPPSSSKAKKGSKKAGRGSRSRYCRLHSLMVKVRDLGLGFESDEIVRFKYCSGSCQRARTNYDLTLSSLLQQRAIVPGPHDHPSTHPCCRPTRYEDFSFMDVRNSWRTVSRVSAAECGCVG